MIKTPYKQLEEKVSSIHPGLQFLIFLLFTTGVLFVLTAVGGIIATAAYGPKALGAFLNQNISFPGAVGSFWIVQLIGTTFGMLLASVFFAYVIVKEPSGYLKTNFHFSWILLVLVFLLMFVSAPITEFLSNINQKMVLPTYLHWMREEEDKAQKIMDGILKMNSVWDMLKNLLLIALLTAIVEEFVFRGVIQTIFVRWTGNIHVAIWVTAVLFSAFHMEFFGFLPRLMLGVLFGYFVAWSGSIWTSVWGHFINNGTAVVLTYVYQRKLTKLNPDDQHLFGASGYLFSFALVLALLFLYQHYSYTKYQTQETDGEELG